jgi:chromate transporter
MAFLMLLAVALLGLPGLNAIFSSQTLSIISTFFRTGALVFGGGHVVLPLLQTSLVPSGWVANDTFLAGYGAAQAVPGPLFSIAAFLGASMASAPTGWSGGILCLLAIFAPSFLLVWGTLPFWEQLRTHQKAQAALTGVNAAVVGLLLAAFWDPVWTSAIHRPRDAAMGGLAFVALVIWKLPPWLIVGACGTAGWLLSLTPGR